MKRGFLVVLLAALILAIMAVLGGCAREKQAVRPDKPKVEVRLPPVESPNVRMRAEQPARPPAEPPSVGDEYRGRWLTLFEVTFPPPDSGEPLRPEDTP
ncbi:MAG: hypothetical protein HZA60_01565 [Deltaproteobacteria bacterium]|nr:hypothetical protein [Deltaproteobacteria bacterium]